MTKSIILLSGGLDSLVSLGISKDMNVKLALTFDYGQKSSKGEIETSANICRFYDIEHKVIKLEWLKNITNTALVSDKEIPYGETLKLDENSMKQVWVPNRNGLFLNIAGSFADAENYTHIIIGANREEAETFSDNTQKFIDTINAEFEYSTLNHPKVSAPLINFDKNDIVKLALAHSIPLELVRSCYKFSDKHCGECESCIRLKNALKNNNAEKFLKLLFNI